MPKLFLARDSRSQAVRLRVFRNSDAQAVEQLVNALFVRFLQQDYTDGGAALFRQYIAAPMLLSRQENNYFTLVAESSSGKLVGVIEIRALQHISMLFVAEAFQRQGIARRLIRRAIEIIHLLGGEPEQLSVFASPYAVPCYRHLGFEATGKRCVESGVPYTPMRCLVACERADDRKN